MSALPTLVVTEVPARIDPIDTCANVHPALAEKTASTVSTYSAH